MTFKAPAKINLMLHVTGKRPDGYHLLQSLMAFADIGDEVGLEPADSFDFSVEGPFAVQVPADAGNLAVRAIRVMEKAAGRPANVSLRLTKTLPAGSGLGGGSADAAAAMRALNTLWDDHFTAQELAALGLELGAELPVCLAGGASWVSGIGECVAHAHTCPSLDAVLVWPGQALATPDVFRAYDQTFSAEMELPDIITRQWLLECGNDLTDTAVRMVPAIARAIDALAQSERCIFARMSGSGSAVFGIFPDGYAAKKTAAVLAAAYPQWWVRACRINAPA